MKPKTYLLRMGFVMCVVLLSSHKTIESAAAGIPIRTETHPVIPHKAIYTIYLSFDDGPSAGSRVVDSLSRVDSLAINVFLVGMNISRSLPGRERLANYKRNPFVQIGNHSYTHALRRYHSYFNVPAEVLEDFDRNEDSLGVTSRLCRLPGRNFFRVGDWLRNERGNGAAAADSLAAHGYSVFGWDLEWRTRAVAGISTHTGEEMFSLVQQQIDEKKTFLPGQIVILLHDQEFTDTAFTGQLAEFVRLARVDGRFSFAHLSDYR